MNHNTDHAAPARRAWLARQQRRQAGRSGPELVLAILGYVALAVGTVYGAALLAQVLS